MKIKKGWDRLALGLALINLLFWPIAWFLDERRIPFIPFVLVFIIVSSLIVFFGFKALIRLILWIIEGFKE